MDGGSAWEDDQWETDCHGQDETDLNELDEAGWRQSC